MPISDWGSDVCSSDLFSFMPVSCGVAGSTASPPLPQSPSARARRRDRARKDSLAINNQSQYRGSVVFEAVSSPCRLARRLAGHFLWRAAVRPSQACIAADADARSEEHTSELQSLMRISYAVFCLNKPKQQ